MAQKHLIIDLKHIGIYRAVNNVTRYDALFLHMEWTRSIGHRSDTLTSHISNYKNHRVFDNTILKRFYYISNILDSSQLSPFIIESMGESCVDVKVDHSISIVKHIQVLKGMSIQDFNHIIQDFFLICIPFSWILFNLCPQCCV